MAVERFVATAGGVWKQDKLLKAQKASVGEGSKKVVALLPDTFMNLSGTAVKPLVGDVKKAKTLIVVYDDMDLPLGTLRVRCGGSAGGHRGVDSIIKAIKTREFIRLRIGVAPTTPSGKIKKPTGEDRVISFLMGSFSPKERLLFDTTLDRAVEALQTIVAEGYVMAMNRFN
jgi:PTH1 family peptidyl-tRNA hydrolase